MNTLAGCIGLIAVLSVSETPLPQQALDEQALHKQALHERALSRQPVALLAAEQGLLTCNRASGTLSLIDPESLSVTAEYRVAGRLSHMAGHPGQATALLLDDHQHRLLGVRWSDQRCDVQPLADLPPHPVRLSVWEAERRVFVSSLWSRKLTVLQFDERFEQPIAQRRLDLPFAPREMLLLADARRLLVADAFGGNLAVVDVDAERLEHVHKLPAHNIRAVALSRDRRTVYLTHQTLDSRAWTDRDDVHWGILMANSLHGVPRDALLDPNREPIKEAWIEPLGAVGRAAGDPGPVCLDAQGRMAVALSGVNEVLVNGASYSQSLPVGRRPTALAMAGDRLFVANQLDDSVTVIDLRSGKTRGTVPLGPPRQLSSIERGERLFFDARLAHDRWMSCHSCHSEGHTTGQLADTLGDGDYGAPKRIPSLLGTGTSFPWAWDGSITSLEQQVRKSIRSTMHGAALSEDQQRDLVSYLTSLAPPPPANSPLTAEEERLVARGREIFHRERCVSCHEPPRYTREGAFDVDLRDESGRRQFNPPSLLGVSQRGRLFHDGRAHGVEDVVRRFRHQLDQPLDESDTAALLAFLKSL